MYTFKSVDLLAALLVFIIAFSIRASLVDRFYTYSFEPDSEACVEETRSFYFFFKDPSRETLPHTLTDYPNYSDGDFITAAVAANIIRPLCKAGIIKAPIGDCDNSLVIFSTRWANLTLDALSAVIAFCILLLLSQSTLISFSVMLFYYLLNLTVLSIDLMRIDHFTLFSANLVFLTTILLLYDPGKKRHYVICGLVAGLVSATKINFPFYLFILAIGVFALIVQRKITVQKFVILGLSFLLSVAIMYHRWLLYPENIVPVIKSTLKVGADWFEYWGNDQPLYYHWHMFFKNGFSIGVFLLLLLAYGAFAFATINAWKKKDAVLIVICTTFILQSLALVFSPKIGRYGKMMPLYMSVFLVYGAISFIGYFNDARKRMFAQLLFLLLLLPSFAYRIDYYVAFKDKRLHRKDSVMETRIKPFEWMKDHVKPGCVVAYQYPRVSNPPVFELPLSFNEYYLTFPFLYQTEMSNFHPPDTAVINKQVNYIIISDKEKNYHLFDLSDDPKDSSLLKTWENFYASLDRMYPSHEFKSDYVNYGVKDIKIYEINPKPLSKPYIVDHCTSHIDNKATVLNWDVENTEPNAPYSFQLQIGTDSSMRWLISGSLDGYPNRYRADRNPAAIDTTSKSFIPPAIYAAMKDGRFNQLIEGNVKDRLPEIENFFYKLEHRMIINDLTFREGAESEVEKQKLSGFLHLIDSIYPGKEILQSKAEQFFKLTGMNMTETDLNNFHIGYSYKPVQQFTTGKKYYWRVRLRFKDKIMSGWSSVNNFSR